MLVVTDKNSQNSFYSMLQIETIEGIGNIIFI